MGLHKLEETVMDLFDAGVPKRQIAQQLGITDKYVDNVTSRYAINFAYDRTHAAAMERGSLILLERIIAMRGGL